MWLLLLSLVLPLQAQSREVEVVTTPAGAAVIDQYGNSLGRSGEPIAIDLSSYGSSLEVTLRLDGYEPKLERIDIATLKEAGRHPGEGSIALRPLNQRVVLKRALKERAAPLVVALVAVLGGFWSGFRKRARERQRLRQAAWLESLHRRATESGDALIGTRLGEYRLLERLGQGGAASVYSAIPEDDWEAQERVAIKLLDPAHSQDPEQWQRFKREVSIWKQLQHRNIVTFYDWGQQEGLTYLVLELVEGSTLRSHFRGQPHSEEEALNIMRPVFSALVYAHEQQITHRDLKPENILVTPSGEPRVTDFGLARAGQEDKLTRTGTWIGTLEYVAPEQIQGKPTDLRTDQYALGVMLYELLLGQPPFSGETQVNTIFQVVTRKPPSIRGRCPQHSEAFCLAVERMLAKTPEKRFASLEEALVALENGLA